jgi:hypothetical protein
LTISIFRYIIQEKQVFLGDAMADDKKSDWGGKIATYVFLGLVLVVVVNMLYVSLKEDYERWGGVLHEDPTGGVRQRINVGDGLPPVEIGPSGSWRDSNPILVPFVNTSAGPEIYSFPDDPSLKFRLEPGERRKVALPVKPRPGGKRGVRFIRNGEPLELTW